VRKEGRFFEIRIEDDGPLCTENKPPTHQEIDCSLTHPVKSGEFYPVYFHLPICRRYAQAKGCGQSSRVRSWPGMEESYRKTIRGRVSKFVQPPETLRRLCPCFLRYCAGYRQNKEIIRITPRILRLLLDRCIKVATVFRIRLNGKCNIRITAGKITAVY